MVPNTTEMLGFGSLVIKESGRQESSIYYLMSTARLQKHRRPGCISGGRSHQTATLSSECDDNPNAEGNMRFSFFPGNSVGNNLPISMFTETVLPADGERIQSPTVQL